MRTITFYIGVILIVLLSSCSSTPGKHLFILSGQSNMARFDPSVSFTPMVQEALGAENVIVVKHAQGGQPIRRWYKAWKAPKGAEQFTAQADLYDSLMTRVLPAIEKQKIESVTFIWMQGERDAREKLGEVYEESLTGLYQQVCDDLNREEVNFIVGRISDYDLDNKRYPHWTLIRKIQMSIGDTMPNAAWINTDDLNDGVNKQGKRIRDDLHMTEKGYKTMGQRFAEKALELIAQE